jgi:hypothetical protein
MAVPEFVPLKPTAEPRSYKSPPHRPGEWRADRPGEVVEAGQPRGDQFGYPGPDQGYAWKLVRRFDGRLRLADGEKEVDVTTGCVGVALKRASLFGRAPIIHDLTVAFTVWGFLGEAPAELVEVRTRLFEGVANPHHYPKQRAIVDAVPEATLCRPHAELIAAHTSDARSVFEGGRFPTASV